MKEVKAKDLIIGEIYSDIDPFEAKAEPTILKFLGREEGTVFFSYFSGDDVYLSSNHPEFGDVIYFSDNNDSFYKID